MKKILTYILLLLSVSTSTFADDINKDALSTYHKLHFSSSEVLDSKVFAIAYKGYLKLKAEDKLSSDVLTICDFSLSSKKYRFWIIDLGTNEVLLNHYVAHGQGSGEEFATKFSNKDGSHQSSLGFYVTGKTYYGKHGYSLYLHGMDKGYNSAAYKRAIVMHGASYADRDFVLGTGRLGRSWGCPALSQAVSTMAINMIKDGSCLFIYYPDQEYLQSSHWLK